MAQKLSAVLDYGTIGRVSALDFTMDEAIEDAKDMRGYAFPIIDKFLQDHISANIDSYQNKIYKGRMQLFEYLINLVEAIVLSDELHTLAAIGPGSSKINLFDAHQITLARLDVNVDRIRQNIDTANNHWEKIESILPHKMGILDDAHLRDVWCIVERVFLQESDFFGFRAINKEGVIDRSKFSHVFLNDEDCMAREADFNDFITGVNLSLGEEFAALKKDLKERIERIPTDIMRPGSYYSRKNIDNCEDYDEAMEERYRFAKLIMYIESFLQYKYAKSIGSIVLPSWSLRPILNKFERMSSTLTRRSIDAMDVAVNDAFSQMSVVTLEGKVPQIVRVCIDGASSVEDVIDNAAKLREMKWAKDYRRYLVDLLGENRPIQLIRKLRSLEVFIEKATRNVSPLSSASISLSPTGDARISAGGLIEAITNRNNPAFIFHTKISHLKTNVSALENISNVTKVPTNYVSQNLGYL